MSQRRLVAVSRLDVRNLPVTGECQVYAVISSHERSVTSGFVRAVDGEAVIYADREIQMIVDDADDSLSIEIFIRNRFKRDSRVGELRLRSAELGAAAKPDAGWRALAVTGDGTSRRISKSTAMLGIVEIRVNYRAVPYQRSVRAAITGLDETSTNSPIHDAVIGEDLNAVREIVERGDRRALCAVDKVRKRARARARPFSSFPKARARGGGGGGCGMGEGGGWGRGCVTWASGCGLGGRAAVTCARVFVCLRLRLRLSLFFCVSAGWQHCAARGRVGQQRRDSGHAAALSRHRRQLAQF